MAKSSRCHNADGNISRDNAKHLSATRPGNFLQIET
jgi:hypothetical protein